MNCESIALYQMQLKDHNINGKVLAACDLNELRDAMQMAFGDWQLFKAWILTARTREQAASTRYLQISIARFAFQHDATDSVQKRF